MKDIYIGLGSNLNNPLLQIITAQQALAQLPHCSYIAHSRSYRTPPLGGMDQPSYINSVSYLRSSLKAEELLLQLQRIEYQQGRQRDAKRWQARTIDLDLLLYGDEIISGDQLTVPHYAIAERNFVVFPLLELNPDIIIPGVGKAAAIATALDRHGLVPVTAEEIAAVNFARSD